MTRIFKSSGKELLEATMSTIQDLCRHAAETGIEPTLSRAFYKGVLYGQEIDIVKDGWHYIELEGLPPKGKYEESEECFVLTKHQIHGWLETNMAHYNYNKKCWELRDDYCQGQMRVIAWHMLPEIPNEL